MKVFLDANILVSVLNKEYPVFTYSSRILSLIGKKNAEVFTSPICLAIAFYFVEKKSGNKVSSTLNAILLKVYRVGSYCDDREINKGSFSETSVFKPLAELRQYFSK